MADLPDPDAPLKRSDALLVAGEDADLDRASRARLIVGRRLPVYGICNLGHGGNWVGGKSVVSSRRHESTAQGRACFVATSHYGLRR